jgi:DNA-binding CsgD family transcriptional regulator/tetratricopeptide (TPR) repeat protein
MLGSPSPTAFVGRAPELGVLRAAFERASAGEASSVVVSGPAGVGKSRLVEEATRDARGDGELVLLGRCVDVGDGELAYAPIVGALRSLAAQLDQTELAEVLGAGRPALARLVPALGEPGVPPDAGPADLGRERLFEYLLTALGRLGERRPVVLVVEDLHWSDGSTRDLLRFLVRSAGRERLALVATCRTDDIDRGHPVRPYVVELRRDPGVELIDLEPLSRAECADHLSVLLGATPSPATLDDLYGRSEGNPFFTEELVGASTPTGLPASLRDAMAVSLERLSPTARRVVATLAALGRRVDQRLVERAATLSDLELPAALREALDARVIVPADDGRGYEFRHALLREAAYEDLLPGEREAVHRDLARELEADPSLAGDGAAAAEVAHHWDAAGDRGRALPAWVAAGIEAERLVAHQEALRHFQRALELWELGPPEAHHGLDQLEITERAADAASAAGEADLAIALAERAVELGGATRAAGQHARLARVLWDGGRGADGLAASTRGLALTPPERTAERARILESHARLLLLTGRSGEAGEPIDEAIAIAREIGASDIEAAALATRVIAAGDRAEDAVTAGREALEVARRDGLPDTLMRAYINAAEALDHGGRVRDSIDLAREGIEEARRLGMERMMGVHLQGEVALRLLKLGCHEEAAAATREGLRAAPEGAAAVALHHAAATLAAHRGDADGAAAALLGAEADDAGSGQSSARGAAARAQAALWNEDAARAWEIADEALGRVEEGEYVWYSAALYALGAWACADRALSAQALGDRRTVDAARAAAEGLVERLDDRLRDTDIPEPAAYRAQAAAELTRLVDAPDPAAWEDAGLRWQRLGYPLHAATCAWREAEALLLLGADRSRAERRLTAAVEEAARLGARPLAEAATDLSRRARIIVDPGGDDATAAPPAGLTPRELEVLRCLVAGRTNRQIGSDLFISEKTVSVHVSRILAKLGAANRAEAATIAHRMGVDAVPRRESTTTE